MSTLDSHLPKLAMRSRRHGREQAAEARWVRPAVFALLALTALAYLWNLGASGDANSFYAAAVQAGTKSWKAFFFGSLDSSSFITTDKPPGSIWVMALSGRIFGFSGWSMLVPQALEGVAAVGLVYATIRRWFGPAAGLAAGAALALTPVAALMFRFNNPDALLVMSLVASAYCLTRALENASTRWIAATGALIGFAFLAKMGQAFLVVPGFGLAYLIAAPTTLRRRIGGALAGLLALVISGGWWVAIVALLPASSRPFIDGSPDNNIFNLIFGYNGLQRLFGGGGSPAGGGGGGGGGGTNFSGSTGTLRLFNDLMGAQASWLLPAALVALAGGLWLTRRAPRTDRTRAALIAWGGWLVVTAAVFSYSQGVIHTYYTVALAPATAALVAIGVTLAWQRRESVRAHAVVGAVVVATGVWSYVLLDRASGWQPWLRVVVLGATAVAVAALVASARPGPLARRSGLVAIVAALIVAFTGPAAYAVQTLTTTHAGSVPSAGPTASASAGGPGRFAGGAARLGGAGRGSFNPPAGSGGALPAGAAGTAGSGPALFGGSGASGSSGARLGRPSGGLGGAGFGGGGATSVSSALVKALEADESAYRWVAATSGSSTAASYELASNGAPVMALGGFNGNGGDLSLARFIAYVRAGDIHYFIADGGGGGPGGATASTTSSITTWVEQHFSAETIGGVTVYDLHR